MFFIKEDDHNQDFQVNFDVNNVLIKLFLDARKFCCVQINCLRSLMIHL